jgi:signal peptidase II
MTPRKKQVTWIASVLSLVFVADQISKVLIMKHIAPHMAPRYDVFFHFTHQRNTGLIGGVFHDIPMIAYIAPVIAFAFLIYMYTQLNPASRLQTIAYGMIMGGAMGNILDRMRLQSVTDFLQFHFYFIPFDFPWKYYPAFNIADMSIIMGVILLFITLTFMHEKLEPDQNRGDAEDAERKEARDES